MNLHTPYNNYCMYMYIYNIIMYVYIYINCKYTLFVCLLITMSVSIVQIMKRDRFTLILRFLHLNDNRYYKKKGEMGHDPLYKLCLFLEPLITQFQRSYTLSMEVCVDESMIGFKGRLSFIQYLPKKPTKWGIKAFVLADSCTGYIYNWHLYTGMHTLLNSCTAYTYVMHGGELGMTAAVVLRLVEPICGRGHHMYMDNLYTSPALFSELRSRGFGTCGTLRLNRCGIPIEAKGKLENGGKCVIMVDKNMM